MDNKDNLTKPLSEKEIDPIEKAIIESKKKIKAEREAAIASLLDKATGVLSEVLDSDDPDLMPRRFRAAELAIALYSSNESSIRADKQLELQTKRLEIEQAKMGMNTLLLQQNNYYPSPQSEPPSKTLVQNSDGSIVDVDLLARKKAQQMLLDAQIMQAQRDVVADLTNLPENEQDDSI